MKTTIFALTSILLSVSAQFALKAGLSSVTAITGKERTLVAAPLFSVLLSPMVILGFLLYGASAVVWLSVLGKWEVSKAYPMVGLGFVFAMVVGVIAGEQVTAQRALGTALILVGVIFIHRT